jgi:hypothetical protein
MAATSPRTSAPPVDPDRRLVFGLTIERVEGRYTFDASASPRMLALIASIIAAVCAGSGASLVDVVLTWFGGP